MREQAAEEVVAHPREPETAGVLRIVEEVLRRRVADREMEVRAGAGAVRERLRHEGRDETHRVRDLGRGHLQEHEPVGRCERVAVRVVDLELAVRVLVVDLVDVDADGARRLRQAIEILGLSREPLVVVAGLLERVGAVARHEPSVRAAREEHELRFDAGEERHALRRECVELALQRRARIEGVRLAVHVTPRAHPRVSGHPRNRLQRVEIADRHVVRAVRPHAESAKRKAGETRAVLQHHAEVLDRHRLRLRRAVDVHELREEVADAVLLEELPCFSRCHGLPLCMA